LRIGAGWSRVSGELHRLRGDRAWALAPAREAFAVNDPI
jgi:hypothetical protein